MNKHFIISRLHDKKINQTKLAQFMGLDKAQVTRLLNGERHLKALEVRPLAYFLGVKESAILDNLRGIK